MITCPLCDHRIPTDDERHMTGDCQCSREKMARAIKVPGPINLARHLMTPDHTWTLHRLVPNPQGGQAIDPPMPLGRPTLVHLKGDPDAFWYEFLPVVRTPPGTTMDMIDGYATRGKA